MCWGNFYAKAGATTLGASRPDPGLTEHTWRAVAISRSCSPGSGYPKVKLPQHMTPNRKRPRRSCERNSLFDYRYEIVKYVFHVKTASRSCSLHFTIDRYGYASFDQGPLGIVLTSHGATEAALAPYIFCTQMIRMIGTAHGASKASVAPW